MTQLYIDFITLCTTKNLRIQYKSFGYHYELFAYEGSCLYKVIITEIDDVTNFETNYKTLSNLISPVKTVVLNNDDEIIEIATQSTLLDIKNKLDNLNFNLNGDLKISMDGAPTDKTEIFSEMIGSVVGETFEDTIYVIPNNQISYITSFEGGSSGNAYSSKITLFYAPSGVVDINSIILAIGYVASSNYQKFLSKVFTGNGTNAIIIRRECLNGPSAEIYAKWSGYF